MLIDIIGSKVFRKVTEFKNFPFYINNFAINQSFLTLTSDPIPTSMKDINTTDLTDITIAYRDLNKGQWKQFLESKSEVLMIDLLGELRPVSEYKNSYYSSDTLKYLGDIQHTKLTRIEQFREIINLFDDEFFNFINSYEKVFLVKIEPNLTEDKAFINGIYNILEPKIKNKILINVPSTDVNNIFDAPLEFYHEVNVALKKYVSDGYENQLLFDERLVDNKLSVFMNYLEEREYIFELLKDGQTIKTSPKTRDRFIEFKLKEPGKYRIRVNLVDESINPRLSQTYIYRPNKSTTQFKYIELPDSDNMWMVDVITNQTDIEGYVGSPYTYPFGYNDLPVYDSTEVDAPYLKTDQLLSLTLQNVKDMDHIAFTQFINTFKEHGDTALLDFINYLRTQR